ncbi:TPA: ead/Ea22-like family protein [Klebsiella pneumoniae]|nr:ead/Ea22-like family protein [Klebsiella pneumoniae]
MTDITELAQSLKAAAEKATPGQWERGDGKHGGELLVYCDDALGSAVCEATSEYNAIPKYQRIDNLDFIALANPANILALVEALEKAQAGEKQWREVVDAFCSDDADWHKLTNSNNEMIALLSQALCKQADRIAELESRTVTVHQSDYFASLVAMARVSADKAMRKFPQPNYVLLKVAEEAGEVVQAGVHYAESRMEWKQVEGEIVQLLAMLIRLVTEGDEVNGVKPPASCAAGIKVEAE